VYTADIPIIGNHMQNIASSMCRTPVNTTKRCVGESLAVSSAAPTAIAKSLKHPGACSGVSPAWVVKDTPRNGSSTLRKYRGMSFEPCRDMTVSRVRNGSSRPNKRHSSGRAPRSHAIKNTLCSRKTSAGQHKSDCGRPADGKLSARARPGRSSPAR
jgi:hypothetical protein